uniref:Secreted protein n=1 Tax=Arundo donax TaxID=35708 RepID=A0A0A9FGJ7_ARUDO
MAAIRYISMVAIRLVHVLVVISSNEKKSSCVYYILDITLQLTVVDKYTHVPYNVLGGSQSISSLTYRAARDEVRRG